MPEATADLLNKSGITCEYRDTISVKGKGLMKVYLTCPDSLPLVHRLHETVSEQAISDIYAT